VFWVYVLKSERTGRYYIGMSNHPERRLEFHNSDRIGYTMRHRPWILVFLKGYSLKRDALLAERRIKNWKSRVMIDRLIRGEVTL